jgi:hypothetical protein
MPVFHGHAAPAATLVPPLEESDTLLHLVVEPSEQELRNVLELGVLVGANGLMRYDGRCRRDVDRRGSEARQEEQVQGVDREPLARPQCGDLDGGNGEEGQQQEHAHEPGLSEPGEAVHLGGLEDGDEPAAVGTAVGVTHQVAGEVQRPGQEPEIVSFIVGCADGNTHRLLDRQDLSHRRNGCQPPRVVVAELLDGGDGRSHLRDQSPVGAEHHHLAGAQRAVGQEALEQARERSVLAFAIELDAEPRLVAAGAFGHAIGSDARRLGRAIGVDDVDRDSAILFGGPLVVAGGRGVLEIGPEVRELLGGCIPGGLDHVPQTFREDLRHQDVLWWQDVRRVLAEEALDVPSQVGVEQRRLGDRPEPVVGHQRHLGHLQHGEGLLHARCLIGGEQCRARSGRRPEPDCRTPRRGARLRAAGWSKIDLVGVVEDQGQLMQRGCPRKLLLRRPAALHGANRVGHEMGELIREHAQRALHAALEVSGAPRRPHVVLGRDHASEHDGGNHPYEKRRQPSSCTHSRLLLRARRHAAPGQGPACPASRDGVSSRRHALYAPVQP